MAFIMFRARLLLLRKAERKSWLVIKKQGGEFINYVNRVLKSKMILFGVTHKEMATELGINTRVFGNKLCQRKVNGYTCRFTEAQKEKLAARFGIAVEEIE